jgi:hypothetical protein
VINATTAVQPDESFANSLSEKKTSMSAIGRFAVYPHKDNTVPSRKSWSVFKKPSFKATSYFLAANDGSDNTFLCKY